MRKSKELLGLPIVAKTTGKKVGEFGEIVVDPIKRQILCITLNNKGNPEKTKVVLYEDIIKFEDRSILIKNQKSVVFAGKFIGLSEIIKQNRQLLNGLVVTDEGNGIGTISDILFDEEDGRITGIELADGLIKDLVEGRCFIPIVYLKIDGDKAVINREAAETIEPSIGGLKKILGIDERG